jgi:hypothetical protein
VDYITKDIKFSESLKMIYVGKAQKGPELSSELTPLLVTHVARRGADQLGHFVLLLHNAIFKKLTKLRTYSN